MVFGKTRKDKGKKQVVLVVEEDDTAANGPRCKRVQNGLEAEMELLRSQLQALIEQLRRDRKQQQHNQHGVVGSATSNVGNYEQLFVHIPKQKQVWHNRSPVMVQPKMPNQNWESRFEIGFPLFDGSLDNEEFVDWLSQVEEIFACYDIPESKKVKLAATNLRGNARSWWEQLKIQRLRRGKTKIHTWEKMK